MSFSVAARYAIGSIAVVATLSEPALGNDLDILIVGQGFCIKKTEMKCEEVALPDATVQFERLPKGADGTRIIYFFSDQKVGTDGLFAHALEAEDLDQAADYIAPRAPTRGTGDLAAQLKALAEKVGHGGAVLVTAFQIGRSSGKVVRVFSSLPVRGPGVIAGQVVDLDGMPVSVSKRLTFSVSRGNGNSKTRRDGGTGMGTIEADG